MRMTAPGEMAKTPWPVMSWMVALTLVCVAVLAYGHYGDKDHSGGVLASQMGHDFVWAVVIGAGLQLLFRQRVSSRTAWFGFVVIWAALVVASNLATLRVKSASQRLSQELGAVLSAAETQLRASESPPASDTAKAASGSDASTALMPAKPHADLALNSHEKQIETVGVLLKGMVNRVLAQRRDYELELDAIGWSTILDPSRLAGDTTMVGSRTLLKQARTIVAKYRARTDLIFEQSRREIEDADLPANMRQSMLNGFLSSSAKGKERASLNWDMEAQVLVEMEKVVDLLSARRGSWEISDGQLLFASQEDIDRFNASIDRVKSLVDQQQRMQQNGFEILQREVKNFGR